MRNLNWLAVSQNVFSETLGHKSFLVGKDFGCDINAKSELVSTEKLPVERYGESKVTDASGNACSERFAVLEDLNVLPIAIIFQSQDIQKWRERGRSRVYLLITNIQPINFLHMDHSLKRDLK